MTALCLTRNRRRWLPKAIHSFERQTYQHKELLIISDGDTVDDLIPESPSIRLIHLRDVLNIGAKRNYGVEQAKGAIVCHFDDDDFSAASRIADQVERLIQSKKQVTAYHTMKFTDGQDWWLYQGAASVGLGTSLCYWREWAIAHPFLARQKSEDGAFVHEAISEHTFISTPATSRKPKAKLESDDLMYATIHAGNTSPRELNYSCWVKL